MPDKAQSELQIVNRWHANDERYVTHGRQLLARAWLKHWPDALASANRGRRGRPFVLPPAMAATVERMLVSVRLSWRALEGVIAELLTVKAPDHTTIWKRLRTLDAAPVVPAKRVQ